MTCRHHRNDWFPDAIPQDGRRSLGGIGGFRSVADSVDGGNEDSALVTTHQILVARLAFARERELRYSILRHRASYGLHFFTPIVVPWPGLETISNSSIKRRTPGNPKPRLPDVEKPSRKAWRISGMPGPSSAAITRIPTRLLPWMPFRVTSPLTAYETMFRASSEMAVAMSV